MPLRGRGSGAELGAAAALVACRPPAGSCSRSRVGPPALSLALARALALALALALGQGRSGAGRGPVGPERGGGSGPRASGTGNEVRRRAGRASGTGNEVRRRAGRRASRTRGRGTRGRRWYKRGAGRGGRHTCVAGVEMVGDGPCRRVVAGVLRGVDLRPAEQISSIFKKGFCLDPRCTIRGDHSGLLHTPVHARNTSPGTADTRATSTVQLGS